MYIELFVKFWFLCCDFYGVVVGIVYLCCNIVDCLYCGSVDCNCIGFQCYGFGEIFGYVQFSGDYQCYFVICFSIQMLLCMCKGWDSWYRDVVLKD